MEFTRINEFYSAPEKNDELFSFLKSLIPYITNSEGCISCEVLRSTESSDKFIVLEKWSSIEAHKKSIALFPKSEMQAAIELFGAPPKGAHYHA